MLTLGYCSNTKGANLIKIDLKYPQCDQLVIAVVLPFLIEELEQVPAEDPRLRYFLVFSFPFWTFQTHPLFHGNVIAECLVYGVQA